MLPVHPLVFTCVCFCCCCLLTLVVVVVVVVCCLLFLLFSDVGSILMTAGLSHLMSIFEQQEIDLQAFVTLSDEDLIELDVTSPQDRKRVLVAIQDYQDKMVKLALRTCLSVSLSFLSLSLFFSSLLFLRRCSLLLISRFKRCLEKAQARTEAELSRAQDSACDGDERAARQQPQQQVWAVDARERAARPLAEQHRQRPLPGCTRCVCLAPSFLIIIVYAARCYLSISTVVCCVCARERETERERERPRQRERRERQRDRRNVVESETQRLRQKDRERSKEMPISRDGLFLYFRLMEHFCPLSSVCLFSCCCCCCCCCCCRDCLC